MSNRDRRSAGRLAREMTPGRRLLLILLLALLVRGLNLGGKSLWLDEAYSVRQGNLPKTARLVFVEANHPPLHYVVLHHWMARFGNGEAAVRLPSLLASTASVFLLYLLARRLATQQVALLAAALLAVSPLDVWYAQEARSYAFLTFFALLMALGMALENWIGGILLFLGLATGLYTGYLIFPLWVGLSAVWLVRWWLRGHKASTFLIWALASAAGWLAYRPWWSYFRNWLENALVNHWMFDPVRALTGLTALTATHFLFVLLLAAAGLVAGSALLVAALRRPRLRHIVTVLAVTAFVTVVLVAALPRLYSVKRVLVTGWAFVVLFVAWLVAQMGAGRTWVRGGLLALSLVATLITVFFVPKDDWRALAAYAAQHVPAGAAVWADPRWNAIPYDHYRPRAPALQSDAASLEEVAAANDEIWLLAERFHGQPAPTSPSEKWLDEHGQLLEAVPFYRLELRHYRLPAGS